MLYPIVTMTSANYIDHLVCGLYVCYQPNLFSIEIIY